MGIHARRRRRAQPRSPTGVTASAGHAIELRDHGNSTWVYALAMRSGPAPRSTQRHVHYDANADTVATDVYRIGFSRALPFLVDSFQWVGPGGTVRTANMLDGMKVRHTGKLFSSFDFLRTQDDYRSELLSVKSGPVRIIRRTRNRVRMFLGLRTPSLYIDYFVYSNQLTMDLIIDLPFKIGLFLSDVQTLTTVDWRELPGAAPMRLLTRAHPAGYVIDGRMSDAKRDIGKSIDTDYVIATSGGDILVTLAIDPGIPIEKRTYLLDDQSLPDPPEAVVGQYGNSGYATTGWERVGSGVYHMLFNLRLVPDGEQPRGLGLLETAPSALSAGGR